MRRVQTIAAWVIGAMVVMTAGEAEAQWSATAYVDNNVIGDIQGGRLGAGVSAGFYLRGGIGLELDGELHGHYFRDSSVAGLAPEGVDMNTHAGLASANVVAPVCFRGVAGRWCPYGVLGVGLIRASFDGTAHAPGTEDVHRRQTDPSLQAGVGVIHALTSWLGFRIDARYIRAFVDDKSETGGYFADYGYCRLSVGLIFGGPASGP